MILESILQTALTLVVSSFVPLPSSTPDTGGGGTGGGGGGTGGGDDNTMKELLKNNILLVLIVLFFVAFVIAAGVEESMKHFVVRCCQFPTPLKDPHTIMVYLLAGALGFATSENISYVFTGGSAGGGITMLEGQLLVLLMRVCTPIHAICSVLQAVNLSKVMYTYIIYIIYITLYVYIIYHTYIYVYL